MSKELENAVKGMMWAMFQKGNQKANLDELEELVNTLIHAATQKTAGQRADKPNDINYDRLEMISWQIAIEATALVLDERFDKVKEMMKGEDNG